MPEDVPVGVSNQMKRFPIKSCYYGGQCQKIEKRVRKSGKVKLLGWSWRGGGFSGMRGVTSSDCFLVVRGRVY